MEPIEPLDPKLQTLFAGEHTHAPEQPFLSELARSLAVERRRRVFRSRVLRVAGLEIGRASCRERVFRVV